MKKIDGLAVEEHGDGPAVVLVHAGIADRRMWRHQVAHLAPTHRVITYDWRGHGDSDDPHGPVTHHLDLLTVMDALGVEQAVLAGCSMGGSHAVEAALAQPHRVRGLALISSGLSGHTWPPEMIAQVRERVHTVIPAERLAAYRERRAVPRPADVAAYARAHTAWQVAGPERDPADLDPQVWELAVDMLTRLLTRQWSAPAPVEHDLAAERRLGEITAPTLVINGLDDVPAIQEVSTVLASGIAGARRVDLPGTGHLPPLQRPAEVNAALTAWLRSLSSPRWP
ncbi:alpha/beta fold hydrolase [Nonomuraea soli]|uniref:Pimeloyl-ACP methyl ester carboxylesterase n=1 Tax=Nonomuraea soli TaxID=1032476 RepID=A0A7W0CHL8_9ACTN|nr:alpha/beta fold hydrolase [Nonomuraea soli]MBA2891137.1 pimeloyl-ACP methyl ester carboxylesterase [Nonomuraea soli]